MTVFICHNFTYWMISFALRRPDALWDWTAVVKLWFINACDTLIIVHHFSQLKAIEAGQTVSDFGSWTLLASWVTFYALINCIYCCRVVTIGTSETIRWEIKEICTFGALRCLSEFRVLTLLTIFRTPKLDNFNIGNSKLIRVWSCL